MKKQPIARTEEIQYPTYAEARRDRGKWLRVVTIGALALGATTLGGCDTIDRLLGRDHGWSGATPGEAPIFIAPDPPGDDDDSAAADGAQSLGDEARPEVSVPGGIGK